MSESPERKVLKETISRMKIKNITSVNNYKMNVKLLFADFTQGLNSLKESLKQVDETKGALFYLALAAIGNEFQKLFNSSIELIDNIQLYIDTLESYSVELTAIFEQAKKYAEEKIKEQGELMNEGKTSYIK